MAKSIWNPADRVALLARFDTLQPGQRPLWGSLSASKMMRHCTLASLAAVGEFAVKPKFTPFRVWPLQQLVIYVLPWPKGAPTGPELIPPDEGDFHERRAALRAAIERIGARGESQPLVPHAAFGKLSAKDWGALIHRHLHHHLSQFGA